MSYLIISLINLLLQLFTILILVEVIGSWVLSAGVRLPEWGYGIMNVVHTLTAPVLNPIRRLMPNMGGLDFSPLIALLLLQVLAQVISGLLVGRF